MEVILLYLLGFAAAGAALKHQTLGFWVVALLAVMLTATIWFTGRA
jgi:hypothetical protein